MPEKQFEIKKLEKFIQQSLTNNNIKIDFNTYLLAQDLYELGYRKRKNKKTLEK